MARQERAIRTREKILVAAAEVFDEVGYEAATISQILQKAEVTKGALYFHFTSKEELAQEVLAKQVSAVPAVQEQDLVLQSVIDQALLLAYLLSMGDPLVRGSVRLTVEQGAPDGLNRQVPMRGWVDRSEEMFARAKADGELLPDTDVASVARVFVGSFTGVQVLSHILTRHQDMVDRVSDLYRHLVSSIAVPGVLVRLDFSPARAEHVWNAARAQARAGDEVALG
ncbi:ScbR family autoregulator-binding transcription factor [Streptomyces ossamyceticus]|nr:ScbR family autoregulator-binding transcription factor [Streptomyces ossamyceticus]